MEKVLIITNSLGGLYSFRNELVQCLLDKNYSVVIAAPDSETKESFIERGCKYIETSLEKRGTNPFTDLGLLLKYIKIIKSCKPDIILTYTIKPNIYGGIAAGIAKVPFIPNITGLGSTAVGGSTIKHFVLILYKAALKKASCVFFQNQKNQEYMLNNKIVLGRNKLIPGSGVNLQKIFQVNYPPKQKTELLFIGRIMKEKGIDELISAAEQIKKKYSFVTFNLVGSMQDDYKAKINECHDAGLLNYLGWQNDIHSIIVNNHATVNPSYHEGMSNVLLESAASGRPVLASEVPGCIETFDEGISGFGFEVKNVDDLVATITKFIELPYEEKKKMGLAGRMKMEKEFDRNIVVKAYLEEIKLALEKK